ncbi:MAG: OmpA family protein [Bacteroidota bacterium]
MKTNSLWLLPLILIPFSAFSQNLVKNPGFEIITDTNFSLGWYDQKLDGKVKYWSSPTRSSSGIIKKTGRKPLFYNDLVSYDNTPNAHSGKFMCKITMFGTIVDFEDRSYLQGELYKPLIKGKTYHIEFWIATGFINTELFTNNIGVAFLKNEFHSTANSVLNLAPLLNYSEIPDAKPKEWYKISWDFVAQDAYGYFIIGNFFTDKRTKSKFAGHTALQHAVYLIDDISLIEADSSGLSLLLQSVELNKPIPLNNVNFETNKSELLGSSFAELKIVIDFLQKKPQTKIEISGHTDITGNEEANIKLSTNRAKAVYDYLITHGISSGRLIYKGYGSSIPKVSNDTPENRAINRRVEFKIVKL